MKINGLILAAGLSSRMKEFKPLMKIRNKPLIQYTIDSMRDAGCECIVLVLGFRGKEIEEQVVSHYAASEICVVYNRDYNDSDMLASIKVGIRVMPECDAFFLLPGDMPAVRCDTFEQLRRAMERSEALAVFPEVNGYRKHPPLIHSRCIKKILEFQGEGGLRGFWDERQDQIGVVEAADPGCTIDTDTREDFEKLKSIIQ